MRRVLNVKNYLIVGLVSLLIIFGISISIKCVKLEKENLKLKTENSSISNLELENWRLQKENESLSHDLQKHESTIDSLKKIKQKVILKSEYVVSNNIIEGVEILKENLRCERHWQ